MEDGKGGRAGKLEDLGISAVKKKIGIKSVRFRRKEKREKGQDRSLETGFV